MTRRNGTSRDREEIIAVDRMLTHSTLQLADLGYDDVASDLRERWQKFLEAMPLRGANYTVAPKESEDDDAEPEPSG